MKIHRILILAIAIFAFAASAEAQTEKSSLENDKDVRMLFDNAPKVQKSWWQFGVTYRNGVLSPFDGEHSVVLNGGYRFNKKNYLGIGAGYGKGYAYIDADCGAEYRYNSIPVIMEYIHNFYLGKARKHSIYLGGELGALHSWETAEAKCEEGMVHDFGTYVLGLKTGMDFQLYQRLHLNFGFSIGLLALGFSAGITF